jgi:hypothetical protein
MIINFTKQFIATLNNTTKLKLSGSLSNRFIIIIIIIIINIINIIIIHINVIIIISCL